MFCTNVSDKVSWQPIGYRNHADKAPPAELVKEKLAAEMLGNARNVRQIAHKTMPKCLFAKQRRWLLKTFIFHDRRQIVSMTVSSNFVVSLYKENYSRLLDIPLYFLVKISRLITKRICFVCGKRNMYYRV